MKSEELIEEKERLMAKQKDKEQRLNVLEQQIKEQRIVSTTLCLYITNRNLR